MADPTNRFLIDLDAPGLTADQRAWMVKARLIESAAMGQGSINED
jgi:hypothetical protein